MYTILKITTFLTFGVDILCLTMVMQPYHKDLFNNITVSFKQNIHVDNFLVPKNSNFSLLTCYGDPCGYIKKVWIVDNAINAFTGLFGMHFLAL